MSYKCSTILASSSLVNESIQANHEKFVKKDYELLSKKNELLLKKDIFNLKDIIEIIKERELLSLIILDYDADMTNALVNLYNLKFIKLKQANLLETLESIKENVGIVNKTFNGFNDYKNKYLE